ncbi:unnamed protein product, partial [Oppiella nova]
MFLYLFVKPFKRGFFCDDTSIRYPYKDNTITDYSLALLVLVPIIATIGGVETYRYKKSRYTTRLYKSISQELYDKFVPFLFGILASLLCTFVAKVSVGRLRPYFHSICKPNIVCDATNAYKYIEDFECTGFKDSPSGAVDEINMSFMSGHSSLMAFSMVYLTIYLQKRMPITQTSDSLIRAMIQGLAVNLAFFVGYTRISDYWHHWSDVMIGLIQGTVAAILTVLYLSDLCVGNPFNELYAKKDSNVASIESNDNTRGNGNDFQIRLVQSIKI